MSESDKRYFAEGGARHWVAEEGSALDGPIVWHDDDPKPNEASAPPTLPAADMRDESPTSDSNESTGLMFALGMLSKAMLLVLFLAVVGAYWEPILAAAGGILVILAVVAGVVLGVLVVWIALLGSLKAVAASVAEGIERGKRTGRRDR
jgi:hypothetical protein